MPRRAAAKLKHLIFEADGFIFQACRSLLRSAGSDLDSPPQLCPESPAPIAPVGDGTPLPFGTASDLLPDRIDGRCCAFIAIPTNASTPCADVGRMRSASENDA